jgi:hypothetical protein
MGDLKAAFRAGCDGYGMRSISVAAGASVVVMVRIPHCAYFSL